MENLFEIKNRMCGYFNNDGCEGCIFNFLTEECYDEDTEDFKGCEDYCFDHPKKSEEILLKWAKENPLKTRKDVFLEQYPNVNLDINGNPYIKPCILEETLRCGESAKKCETCSKQYWNETV